MKSKCNILIWMKIGLHKIVKVYVYITEDCVQIIKIDDQYNFININKVGDFEIKNDTLYKKLIENLNRKTILFIWEYLKIIRYFIFNVFIIAFIK